MFLLLQRVSWKMQPSVSHPTSGYCLACSFSRVEMILNKPLLVFYGQIQCMHASASGTKVYANHIISLEV